MILNDEKIINNDLSIWAKIQTLIWYSTMQLKSYSHIRVLYIFGKHYSIHTTTLTVFQTSLTFRSSQQFVICRKRHSSSAETDPAFKRYEWWLLRFPAIDTMLPNPNKVFGKHLYSHNQHPQKNCNTYLFPVFHAEHCKNI